MRIDCAGALLPFTSREDVDFFSHLEMHLRQDHPPLAGRDHMAFRGAYYPVCCLLSATDLQAKEQGS